MAKKLNFNVEAIDGSFKRQYDTVEEFKQKELGMYVGLNSYSMTSSDGVCVFYPADDYTKQQIELYQAEQLTELHRGAGEYNTQVIISEGSGLGYANLQIMKQHNKKHGNDVSYYVETDAGRFFIETRDDQSYFTSMQQQTSRFSVHGAKLENMVETFSKEKLGFGTMKKEGINCFVLNTNTLLVQDKNKKHNSLEAIRAVKMSAEKAVVSSLRTVTYDGNEDTRGTTSMYHPAVMSVDSGTYYSIIAEHYPEFARNDHDMQYDYDEHCRLDMNTQGFRFDKEHPVYHESVSGFDADIMKDGEKVQGKVLLIDKECLERHHSIDSEGLTIGLPDESTLFLELGKSYDVTGGFRYNETQPEYKEISKDMYKKHPEKDLSADFLF